MRVLKRYVGVGALGVVLGLEVLARAAGVIDFPLYEANREIGYIPKASQSGSFLRKNDWSFNAKSMGAPEFVPSAQPDLLLIGDSIVYGGNPYRQQERLGPQLQKLSGTPVWPISAGSWALRNELTYLRLNPDVVRQVDSFVFVLNKGDFDQASSWSCETSHPRSRPALAMLYLFQKYVWDWRTCGDVLDEMKVPEGDWKQELKVFLLRPEVQGKPIAFFLYPTRTEMNGHALPAERVGRYAAQIRSVVGEAAMLFDVGRDPRWSAKYYRDDYHPSPEGTAALAAIIHEPRPEARLP